MDAAVVTLAVIALAVDIVTLSIVASAHLKSRRHLGESVVEGWTAVPTQKTVGHDDPTKEHPTPVETPTGKFAARGSQKAGK